MYAPGDPQKVLTRGSPFLRIRNALVSSLYKSFRWWCQIGTACSNNRWKDERDGKKDKKMKKKTNFADWISMALYVRLSHEWDRESSRNELKRISRPLFKKKGRKRAKTVIYRTTNRRKKNGKEFIQSKSRIVSHVRCLRAVSGSVYM